MKLPKRHGEIGYSIWCNVYYVCHKNSVLSCLARKRYTQSHKALMDFLLVICIVLRKIIFLCDLLDEWTFIKEKIYHRYSRLLLILIYDCWKEIWRRRWNCYYLIHKKKTTIYASFLREKPVSKYFISFNILFKLIISMVCIKSCKFL